MRIVLGCLYSEEWAFNLCSRTFGLWPRLRPVVLGHLAEEMCFSTKDPADSVCSAMSPNPLLNPHHSTPGQTHTCYRSLCFQTTFSLLGLLRLAILISNTSFLTSNALTIVQRLTQTKAPSSANKAATHIQFKTLQQLLHACLLTKTLAARIFWKDYGFTLLFPKKGHLDCNWNKVTLSCDS